MDSYQGSFVLLNHNSCTKVNILTNNYYSLTVTSQSFNNNSSDLFLILSCRCLEGISRKTKVTKSLVAILSTSRFLYIVFSAEQATTTNFSRFSSVDELSNLFDTSSDIFFSQGMRSSSFNACP